MNKFVACLMQVQEELAAAQADRQVMGETHAAQAAQLQSELARQGAQLAGDAEAAEKLQAVSRSQEDRILALQQVGHVEISSTWPAKSCRAGRCSAETGLTV